jgi:hypothetical protein
MKMKKKDREFWRKSFLVIAPIYFFSGMTSLFGAFTKWFNKPVWSTLFFISLGVFGVTCVIGMVILSKLDRLDKEQKKLEEDKK